jgi:hypothetical protein
MLAPATALPPLLRVRVPEQVIKFTGFSIKLDAHRCAFEGAMVAVVRALGWVKTIMRVANGSGRARNQAERSLSTL